MKTKDFKKLVREHKDNLQKLISMHCMDKIYLTDKQLDEVLKLRGDR
jgi:hypothetical protein